MGMGGSNVRDDTHYIGSDKKKKRKGKSKGLQGGTRETDTESSSANLHREFLLNTLHEVRSQLANPSPLLESLAVSSYADNIQENKLSRQMEREEQLNLLNQ